jgi:tRNA A37 threonylcarbamoyladenosine modification protein TsaB
MKILTVKNILEGYEFLLQTDSLPVNGYFLQDNPMQSDELIHRLEEFLKQSNLEYDEVDVLSITNGPNNFTTLKVLIAVAKGFRVCFPKKQIITNNLFEILGYGKDYDLIALELRGSFLYVYDKKRYYCLPRDDLDGLFENKNDKIITNSQFLLDFSKKGVKLELNYFEDSSIIGLNYKKTVKGDFDNALEPLYVREPDVFFKKR